MKRRSIIITHDPLLPLHHLPFFSLDSCLADNQRFAKPSSPLKSALPQSNIFTHESLSLTPTHHPRHQHPHSSLTMAKVRKQKKKNRNRQRLIETQAEYSGSMDDHDRRSVAPDIDPNRPIPVVTASDLAFIETHAKGIRRSPAGIRPVTGAANQQPTPSSSRATQPAHTQIDKPNLSQTKRAIGQRLAKQRRRER